jgi:dephospho-CoA kinase
MVILESMYSWEEYKIIKTKHKDSFKVLTVIASPDLRFARLTKRKKERPIKNRKEFDTRNYTEIEKTDKGGPIAMADFNIINEGTRKSFYQNLDLIIKKLK